MKKNIHPAYFMTEFACINCGTTHSIRSTIDPKNGPVKIEICSACHPAYNKGKIIEVKVTKGRLQAYQEKLERMKAVGAK